MLDHSQELALGQVEDLAGLAAFKPLGGGERAAAAIAALGLMLDPLVGNSDRLKPRPIVTLLASLLATRGAAQAALLRRRLAIAVGGRRLGGVARALPEARHELCDLGILLVDPGLEPGDHRGHRIRAPGEKRLDFCPLHARQLPCRPAESLLCQPCLARPCGPEVHEPE